MAITTFDTLKFVRRLEQAGVPLAQAEAQAEVLTEAFKVNLKSLVTTEQMAARFAEQDARLDARFAQVEAKLQFMIWSQAIITAAVLIPLFERLFAL